MSARRLALLLALPLSSTLATVMGCSSPSSNELFAKTGISSASGGVGGSAASASAGTEPVAHQDQTTAGTSATLGGSTAAGSGGAASGGSAGSAQAQGGSSGSGGQASAPPPVIESCDMLEGAVTNEQNGHCYRLNPDELTYSGAGDACLSAGGHLLTVTSAKENDFAHELHDGEHWLGAHDGRSDATAGVGEYAWVGQEEWTYSDWRDGQPNAVETDCQGRDGGGGCFEHCAYQTEEGDWIDRSCGQTIPSICEWEPQVAR